MWCFRLIALLILAGCNGEIYVRDGVTDGDVFYLAPVATVDSDPVLQSWVTYSLVRSVCQLEMPGDNPARQNSYDCELMARNSLVDAWAEKRAVDPHINDDYLDAVLAVREAGYLDEYTAHYFRRSHWQVPVDIDVDAFANWRQQHLRHHRPQTRVTGYWAYRDKTVQHLTETN